MSGFTLREALQWLDSGRLHGRGDERVSGVSTDTRGVGPGQLFVALRGERFDAHDFLALACERGAAAVMVERPVAGLSVPMLVVPDTRRALGELARGWRRQFQVVLTGITGSNGKTTVKEMLASILAVAFGASQRLATRGNLNNDIGVPLTVLELRARHRAAAIELGMNRPGEIAWLAEIAAPHVAVVNNAQREHQEFMGSVRATAVENGAVLQALPDDGIAVFPGDEPFSTLWRELSGTRRRVEFGYDGADNPNEVARADADWVSAAAGSAASGFRMEINAQAIDVCLAIDGQHNVRNALAAAAAAHACGIDLPSIARGLAEFVPVPGRLVRQSGASGAQLIDDTYNANPDSVRAAIEVLAEAPSPRILVLGDMGELGPDGAQFHREVGRYAAEHGIETLLALGDASADAVAAFGIRGTHYTDVDSLIDALRAQIGPTHTVLVKGSRFMRMERVVRALAASTLEEAH